MSYFSPDLLQFFKDLAANNHKEWFDSNRKRYEQEVRDPFKQFVGDLIGRLSKIDSDLDLEPKQCIFRINRDIRFSKDKTPYKLNTSAAISRNGRKDMDNPGIYVELGPERTAFFMGLYMPGKETIERVRLRIMEEPKRFRKVIENNAFQENFGEIQGAKNKILPKEFKEAAGNEPLLFNKSWYVFTNYEPETALREDLLDFMVERYHISKDFKDFLQKAADRQ